jgi:hypothetical protein
VIPLNKSTNKNNRDCTNTINAIVHVNHINLPRINSYLSIGFDKIRKIVFHSTSLNRSWLQTNITHINQKISIIANQKSTIIFSAFPSVSCPRDIEKIININQKNNII